MTWAADYSVVAPEQGDQIDLVGLVTMDNQSGKTFTDARIKLMAGDVNKVQPDNGIDECAQRLGVGDAVSQAAPRPASRKRPSTSTTSTACRVPPPCTTARPSRSSSCAPRASPPHVFYVYDGVKIDQQRYRQLELREHPQPVRLRHAEQPEGVGHARVQELGGQPPGHPAAQGPRALLPARQPTGNWSSRARTPSTTRPRTKPCGSSPATPST